MIAKEISVACGCSLKPSTPFDNVWIITYCPFHAATGDLLAACRLGFGALKLSGQLSGATQFALDCMRAAIALAEKKPETKVEKVGG